MNSKRNTGAPEPLPRELLPSAQADAASPVWESRLQRIVAAAEPRLRERSARHGGTRAQRPASVEAGWADILGNWWRQAVAATTVAAASVLLSIATVSSGEAGGTDGVLRLIASGGDPGVLWESSGGQADSVLALLILEGPEG